ncbi:hypothetical protein AAZX31_08G011100 [Glycine max]|nr:hypothetical protein GLYMA_08G011202v4 [Glycine max]KAH1049032.1 hypothetical protein GYH30_019884 [Glycine max]
MKLFDPSCFIEKISIFYIRSYGLMGLVAHLCMFFYYAVTDTFRKYKEKFTSQNTATAGAKIPDDCMEDLSADIKVGSRCEVEPGAKRGVVKFVGRAESLGPGF